MEPESDKIIFSEADFNCFVDEVEFQETEESNLTFFYFGVLVSTNQFEIEDKVKEILSCLGTKKFHSHKTYKNPLFKDVCDKLNALIIDYNLQIICFPFVKKWLDNPSLAVLKTFELPDLKRVNSSNYRSQAWLLFIHALNRYMIDNHASKKTRILFDSDWLKKNEMVVHEGDKLTALAEIYSTVQKNVPLLALADHVGYLFQKFKKVSFHDEGIIKLHPFSKEDFITMNAVSLFEHLTSKSLFHTLDKLEWSATVPTK